MTLSSTEGLTWKNNLSHSEEAIESACKILTLRIILKFFRNKRCLNFLILLQKFFKQKMLRKGQVILGIATLSIKSKDNKLLDTQTCQNQQTWVCCIWFLHVKSKLRIKFAYLIFIIFDVIKFIGGFNFCTH